MLHNALRLIPLTSVLFCHCAHAPPAVFTTLTYPDGKLYCSGSARSAAREGIWTCWYQQGAKQNEIEYADGKRNGWSRFWFESGTLDVEAQWQNGLLHGQFRSFFPAGGLHITAEYKEGLLHGHLTERNAAGEIIEEDDFLRGQIVLKDGVSEK